MPDRRRDEGAAGRPAPLAAMCTLLSRSCDNLHLPARWATEAESQCARCWPQDADLRRELTRAVRNRRLSREVRIRNERRTHHGHLETRSDFLSLTPDGHEGASREAGLCRGV